MQRLVEAVQRPHPRHIRRAEAGSASMARSSGSPGMRPIASQVSAETTTSVTATCNNRLAMSPGKAQPPRVSFTAALAAFTIRPTSLLMVTSLKPMSIIFFAYFGEELCSPAAMPRLEVSAISRS